MHTFFPLLDLAKMYKKKPEKVANIKIPFKPTS